MSFELIETVTLDSAATSIEFTSIPQDGTDLVLKVSLRTDGAEIGGVLGVRLNGDTGSNFTVIRLLGDGATTLSDAITTTQLVRGWKSNGTDSTSNTFANNQLYISNYTSSSAKSISFDSVTENNATAADQTIAAGTWTGTAGVTTITVVSAGGNNFVAGSTASLYKITAA